MTPVVFDPLTGSLERQGAPDKNFVYVQGSAAPVWTVVHNLGKYPAVAVIDSGGNKVNGDVSYDTLDQVTITFAIATGGKAVLN